MTREASITAYEDGPFLVRGPIRIVGEDGEDLDVRREIVPLCRCGRSRAKPLCDGSHGITRRPARGADAPASRRAGS